MSYTPNKYVDDIAFKEALIYFRGPSYSAGFLSYPGQDTFRKRLDDRGSLKEVSGHRRL